MQLVLARDILNLKSVSAFSSTLVIGTKFDKETQEMKSVLFSQVTILSQD